MYFNFEKWLSVNLNVEGCIEAGMALDWLLAILTTEEILLSNNSFKTPFIKTLTIDQELKKKPKTFLYHDEVTFAM